MEGLSKYPGLERKKSGIYAVRMRIPKDIIEMIEGNPSPWNAISLNPGSPLSDWRDALSTSTVGPSRRSRVKVKREFKRSLEVRQLADAKPVYFALMNSLEGTYGRIRTAYSGRETVATKAELDALAQDYFAQIELEADRRATKLLAFPEECAQARNDVIADLSELESGHPSTIGRYQNRAKALLVAHGFATDSESLSMLSGLLIHKTMASLESSVERFSGVFKSDTASPQLFHAPTQPITTSTLASTFSQYAADKSKLKPKSAEYLEAFGRLMTDFFGEDKPLHEITRQNARGFMSILEYMPPNVSKSAKFKGMRPSGASAENKRIGGFTLAPATLKKHASNFRAFFDWCHAEQLVAVNVAKKLSPVSANPRKRKKRSRFNIDELNLIFGPSYRERARPGDKASRLNDQPIPEYARYWVPLIALFSGMRLQEICQLETTAIGELAGVHYISTAWDINEELDDVDDTGRTKHLKNDSSERLIPVHPELVRLGLLEHVARRREAEDPYLFMELKPRKKDGKVSRGVGDWFARYLDEIGITSESKVFHSFRYCFRAAMGRARLNPDIIRQVGGWSAKDTADKYADGLEMQEAQNEIALVCYDGLDLSHLYPENLR